VLNRTVVRFAGVGTVNTAIDTLLFLMLHRHLGVALANFVSTSTGMVFSFVVNGLFTFRATRLTLREALLFLATNGVSLWIVQPLVILGLLHVLDLPLAAKLGAIILSTGVNFAAYRVVVWPRGS
jgi:putative flippase GtrA